MKVPNDLTEPLNDSRVFSWSKRCLEEGTFRRLGGGPDIQISLRVGTYPYRHPCPLQICTLVLGENDFAFKVMLVLGLYFVAYIVNFLCL